MSSPSIESPIAGIEHRIAQAEIQQLRLHFLFGLHVVGFLALAHAKQWRLSDIHVPAGDQVVHLAVEEREQQRANMRAIDVGVGHDDHAAVAPLDDVLLGANAGADGGDHAANFFVGQHFVFAAL